MDNKQKYQHHLASENWKLASELCKKRDGYRCRLCNGEDRLNAHHRTYEHRGDELNHLGDLTTLCGDCHSEFHKRIDSKIKDQFVKITEPMLYRLQSGSKSQAARLKFVFGITDGFRWIDLIGEIVPQRTWEKALAILRK